MPNNDDIEQGNPPITPPEGDIKEQEALEPEPEPVPAPPSGRAVWVGAPDTPRQASDGISDLFEVETEDDTSDLISVDIDKDIIDANEETGDLSDLVEVSEEDILGDEETGQVPLEYKPDVPKRRLLPRYRRIPTRYVPPTSARGIGG